MTDRPPSHWDEWHRARYLKQAAELGLLDEDERGERDDGDPEGDWADLERREEKGEYDRGVESANKWATEEFAISRRLLDAFAAEELPEDERQKGT